MTYKQMEPIMSKSKKSEATAAIEPSVETTVMAQVDGKKQIEHDYQNLIETHKSKSAVIRFLHNEGFERGQIAKFMGIKYQFVRNVLIVPVKKPAA